MQFKKVLISELKPAAYNPRKNLTDKDPEYQRIKRSIEEFGYVDPVIVNADYTVIGGHQRLKVLKDLGEASIDVVVVDIPKVKEKALNIALNKITGEWDFSQLSIVLSELKEEDFDISITGFSDDELKQIDEDLFGKKVTLDTEPQISRAEELRKEWGTELGQMWQCGEHRVICGDCTDPAVVARVMQGEKADMVFTSPPYAVGVDYASYNDTLENLREMLPKLAGQWYNLVVPGGFAVVNFEDIVSAQDILETDEPCEYPMALEYWPVFRAAGWVLWSRRIWCKPGAGTGSMQCISSNRAATNWEHIWTWKTPGPTMFPKQTTGEYPSQNGWFDSSHSTGLDVKLKVHGAGMPLLPAMFSISNHSTPRGIVFEPFTGTGTTMIACENLGRRCRGAEIDPGYVAVILQRYKDTFPGKEIRLIEDGGK